MRTLKFSSLLLCSTLFLNCSAGPLMDTSVRKIMRTGLADPETAAEMVEKNIGSADIEDLPKLYILAGEYRRLNGEYKASRVWFQKVIEETPTASERNSALLGMALIDFDSGKADALATIRTALETDVPDTLNASRYLTLYKTEMDSSSNLATVYKEKAKKYADSHPITQKEYATLFGNADNEKTTPKTSEVSDETESVMSESERVSNVRVALQAKDWGTVIASADVFLKDYPNSEYTMQVTAYKERASAQEPFVNNRIAVLLPLSGKYGPAAEAIKRALEFSARDSSLELKFYDTGWEELAPVVYKDTEKPTEAELAQQEELNTQTEAQLKQVEEDSLAIVRKAVLEDGCALIIGPLLKEVAPSAAQAAAAYGIPMLSLANSSAILDAGPEVHQVSLSVPQQIDALLDHVMVEKEWKTFVAMVPDSDYGKEALEAFQTAVTAKGGTLLRWVEYPADATNFVTEARRLGLKSEIRPTEKELEKDPTLDNPTLDFDAIFLPDNHRKVPLITATLAAEEFSIGTFRINKHAKPVGVIGLNKWNHPSVVKNGGQYMQKGIFVDAFWIDEENAVVTQFVSEFEAEFGKKPIIIDALAHDAIQISVQVFNRPQSSRMTVEQTLHTVQLNQMVTGGKNFGEQQVLNRSLHVIELKGDELQKWKPPTDEGK